MSDTIKIGDKVSWRGAWGSDPSRIVTVTGMELCEGEREKYGIPVEQVFVRDKDRTVFTLSSGNWAYGFQVTPLRA